MANEYDAELVAQGLQTRLEAEMAAALDAVEVAWTANGDPVTLPDVVTWHFGHKPTVLDMDSSAFPFVSVIPTGAEPKAGPSDAQAFQEERFRVVIDYFVVATAEETCTKICHRYAQAFRSILQAQRSIQGYSQVDRKPKVSVTELIIRHGVTTDSDMLVGDAADVDYIQWGRVEVHFEGGS